MSDQKEILKLIPIIMGEIGTIEKTRSNRAQGYSFRGIDDIYAALQGPLVKHGVFYVPKVLSRESVERDTKSGGTMISTTVTMSFTFMAKDGSSIEVVTVGEAMDSGDKSSNKAMSAALKYAVLQLFCIPTEEDNDTGNNSPEIRGRNTKPAGEAKAASIRTAIIAKPAPSTPALVVSSPGTVVEVDPIFDYKLESGRKEFIGKSLRELGPVAVRSLVEDIQAHFQKLKLPPNGRGLEVLTRAQQYLEIVEPPVIEAGPFMDFSETAIR